MQIQVEFFGSIAFVPLTTTDSQQASKYLAVVPDLRRPFCDPRIPTKDHTIEEHICAIVAPDDRIDWDNTSKQPGFFTRRAPSPFEPTGKYVGFPLNHEHVLLKGLKEGPLHGAINPITPRTTTAVPAPGQRQELQWLPSLQHAEEGDLREGVSEFNSNLLHSETFVPKRHPPTKPGATATILIDTGRLHVADVSREKSQPIVYGFQVGSQKPEWSQAIYERLFWETEFDPSSSEFVAVCRDHRDEQVIAFNTTADSALQLVVACICPSALREDGDDRVSPDTDMAIGYFLSAAVPSEKEGLPIPRPVFPEAVAGTNSRRCRGVQFARWPILPGSQAQARRSRKAKTS